MKKFLLICGLICITVLSAACVSAAPSLPDAKPPAAEGEATELLYDYPVKDGHYILEDEQLGLAFGIPVRQMEDRTIYFGQFALQDSPASTPPLDGMQVFYFPPGLIEEAAGLISGDDSEETQYEVADMIYTRSRLLYSIQYYSAELWDSWLGSGKNMADITGNKENGELGRQNGRVYVYTAPAPSEQGLSEEELPAYRQAVAAIPAMRGHAAMLEQAPATAAAMDTAKNAFPAFSALDIYGEPIDSSIFADYDLTMLNIWGTFCGPCIMEMPDLGEMAAAMPEGAQLVGLVGDALNKETIGLAQTIAEETGAAYPHIVPDKALFDFLNRDIAFYPTTLFIDSRGRTVGEPIIGAMSRAKYDEELNKRLQMLL